MTNKSLASAVTFTTAAMATVSSGDFPSAADAAPRNKSLRIIINATAVTGTTPSCTFSLQGVSASGAVYNILTSAAVTAAGVTTFLVGPTITAASNVAANAPIPSQWQVVSSVPTGTTPSYTVNVDADYSN